MYFQRNGTFQSHRTIRFAKIVIMTELCFVKTFQRGKIICISWAATFILLTTVQFLQKETPHMFNFIRSLNSIFLGPCCIELFWPVFIFTLWPLLNHLQMNKREVPFFAKCKFSRIHLFWMLQFILCSFSSTTSCTSVRFGLFGCSFIGGPRHAKRSLMAILWFSSGFQPSDDYLSTTFVHKCGDLPESWST